MTSLAQNYKAEQIVDHGVSIVRLSDAAQGVEVSVAPGIGNRAYEMKVHGKNILYFPFADVGGYFFQFFNEYWPRRNVAHTPA